MIIKGVVHLDWNQKGETELTYPVYIFESRERLEHLLGRRTTNEEVHVVEFEVPDKHGESIACDN